jgi:hypothetical protein
MTKQIVAFCKFCKRA